MRLRTMLGPSAGEVREYAYLAGVAAVQSGTAEPVDLVRPRVVIGTSSDHGKTRVLSTAQTRQGKSR